MKFRRAVVFHSSAGAREMEVVVFEASVVAVNSAGDLLIAVFDGGAQDRCVGIWRCKIAAGEALRDLISSAIKSKDDEK